jgi:tRNA G18 (ribose-2'-O)-methylase SpoU
MNSFQVRVCDNPACGLRYPLVEANPFGERCPVCLGSTTPAARGSLHPEAGPAVPAADPGPGPALEALLDNVRSAWNVGAIFRTADGLGIRRLHLCGITPTPENESVRKTALGAEQAIPWTHARNAVSYAASLKAAGNTLVALEQDERSIPLTRFIKTQSASLPLILIVGNEVTGVDPGLLELSDHIVHIPMLGRKKSLNVEVAFGIAASMLLLPPEMVP